MDVFTLQGKTVEKPFLWKSSHFRAKQEFLKIALVVQWIE
jgi:hypothetical protein